MTSFRVQLALMIGFKIVLLSALVGVTIWALLANKRDYSLALEGYNNLKSVYEIGEGVQQIRQKIREVNRIKGLFDAVQVEPDTDVADLAELIRKALIRRNASEMNEMASRVSGLLKNYKPIINIGDDLEGIRQNAIARMDILQTPLQFITIGLDEDFSSVEDQINQALVDIGDLSAGIRQGIEGHEKSAEDSYRMIRWISSLFLLMVVSGLLGIGIKMYRSFMSPLKRLGEGVREMARGNLSQRMQETGPLEFAVLAMNFNAMANQIQTLCENLENDVATKSRELIQSERLASVGRLAAGVAHEINNPMGIIAGHAELTLKDMDRLPMADALAESKNALNVIAQEAFRCKEIVNRLLSMSRGGEGARAPISLSQIIADVAASVGGLLQNQTLSFNMPSDPMNILGVEGEIRQVTLNLVVNAVEATRESQNPGGEVGLTLSRNDQWIELTVTDNGKGMTPQVLEHVFEPFFTDKRGVGNPGTGLGLSISHAIVKRHGGEIVAYSDGPGAGTRFVVKWPALDGEKP